jgi:hypothetical protein
MFLHCRSIKGFVYPVSSLPDSATEVAALNSLRPIATDCSRDLKLGYECEGIPLETGATLNCLSRFQRGFLQAPAVQKILKPLASNKVDHHHNRQDSATSNRCVKELCVINGQSRKVLSKKAR